MNQDDQPKQPFQYALEAIGMPEGTKGKRLSRLLDASQATTYDDPASVLYQHTVFCQTGLPYRNPGDDVIAWEQSNGRVHLKVKAGEAMHPEKRRLVQLGLPYGPKPRLILAHLNGEALRQGSRVIEVDQSLTAFVKRLRLDAGGRTIATIKDQLARLSAASITLGMMRGDEAVTVHSQIVTAFNLWFPKNANQRVLWPSTVKLSAEYFESLAKHAVPLHDEALAALSGNAMALDVYAWLAQRLHRIEVGKRVFIPWPTLQEQFGWHYERTRDFRRVFRQTLRLVHTQYRGASFEVDSRGMVLLHSPTPVKARWWPVQRLP